MEKDFDKWNKIKKDLELNKNNILFKQGDIWWTSIGINIGQESCGKGTDFRRPVLIYKKLSSNLAIVIPLSTKIKKGSWFAIYRIHGIKYTALLYQIKMVHINRLVIRKGKLNTENFNNIKKKLKQLLSF